jgi:hypothetical protein
MAEVLTLGLNFLAEYLFDTAQLQDFAHPSFLDVWPVREALIKRRAQWPKRAEELSFAAQCRVTENAAQPPLANTDQHPLSLRAPNPTHQR